MDARTLADTDVKPPPAAGSGRASSLAALPAVRETEGSPRPAAIIARHMPIYEYRCRNGHDFEVFQSMSDPPVEACEVCGEPVERVFSPVAVHYKGSGFYTTDYARKGAKGGDGDGAAKGDGKKAETTSGSKSDSGSKKTDSATASKSSASD